MSRTFPHTNVFVRLAPSSIHGVGVFAIRPIKKGIYVFGIDDSEIVWVKKSATKNLSKEIKKLYEDFCILKNGKYGCPDNFNNLTPTWYLNNSKNPNLAADNEYRFYAIRNIKRGEELTADYDTYSD
jgi:SET domain-containing protein